jgi:hypothetical protein
MYPSDDGLSWQTGLCEISYGFGLTISIILVLFGEGYTWLNDECDLYTILLPPLEQLSIIDDLWNPRIHIGTVGAQAFRSYVCSPETFFSALMIANGAINLELSRQNFALRCGISNSLQTLSSKKDTVWTLDFVKALRMSAGIEIERLELSGHAKSEVNANCSSTGGQHGSP